MIIDTHTHIYLNEKSTEKEILDWLKKDWIEKIMSIWIDLETSQQSIDYAKKYPWIVYPTIWIHPSDVWKYKDNFEATINKLEKMLIDNIWIVKWIWECWFDFFRIDHNNFEEEKATQERFFKAQIKLAMKYSLPLVIHTRNAKEVTLATLQELWAKKFVLHCFSEDLDFAYKAIYYSDECMVSFSWIVTYKSATNVQKTAANIPLSRILVETDCPFLSPQRVRWTENIPNNTRYVLEKVCELRKENWKKETPEEVENQIYKNSLEFFEI